MAMDFGKSGANRILKKVAADNESNQNAKAIVDIPVEKIDINPDNSDVFNMRGIAGLANEILEHGFSGGIEVVEEGNGRYEVIAGHRRFAAVQSLGWEKVPCIIYKPMDPITKAEKLISSNIYNREMSPLDWARAIDYYKKKILTPLGVTNKRDMCKKKFRIKETTLLRFERILKLAPSLQELMAIEDFPYTVVVNMEVYNYPVEVQDLMARQIKEYIDSQDVQEREQISFVQVKTILIQNIEKYKRQQEDALIIEKAEAEKNAAEDAENVRKRESKQDTPHMVHFENFSEEQNLPAGEMQSFAGIGKSSFNEIGSGSKPIPESTMETELRTCFAIIERAKNFTVQDASKVKNIIERLKKTLEEIENEI